MSRKIKCFVSFSGTDGDERSIEFLIERLNKDCDRKVQFLVYNAQKSGSDLADFMKHELSDSEAVIALLSPDYKKKCDEHISSGVLTEHLIIVDRLEGKRPTSPVMLLVPICWKGQDFDSAVPLYYKDHHLARDLRKFKAYGSGDEPYLPSHIEAAVKRPLRKIVLELLSRWDEADPEFTSIKQSIEETLLLESATVSEDPRSLDSAPAEHLTRAFFIKSERTPVSMEDFSERYFVRTLAFRAIGFHHKMAFTGRKGSGKTTLLKVYKHQNRGRYFPPIDIEVNDWNLHYLLEDFTFKSAEGDLYYTAEESKIFDFIWPIFLSLCIVRSLCEARRAIASDLMQRYTAQFEAAASRYESLFQISIGIVRDFIGTCIDNSSSRSESEFKADLSRLINVQACTEYLLGHGYRKLLSITESDNTGRRFLFCLDRFDTEIQKYRKDSKDQNVPEDERRRREKREVFWIQGLVELIDSLRSPDYFSQNQAFYRLFGPHIDFCVPLPKDRLYEVQVRRRDAVVGDIYDEISWQPYELLTMLRKRLQIVWNIGDEKIDKDRRNALQRFQQVLLLSGRRLPLSVQIRLNGATFACDVFLNTLRHSFFRPRDILIYYARIITGVEMGNRRGKHISADMVAKYISEASYRVVEDEFLGEFSDTFKNIRDVVHLFRASKQILNYEEITSKIDGVNFKIYGEDDLSDQGKKIKFLYEIGFLGVSSPTVQLGGVSKDDYDFYFFNPRIALNLEQFEVLSVLSYAIHPVFTEYLSLQMNANAPVMMLDWDKIDQLDRFE
jgi:hypothetical protein